MRSDVGGCGIGWVACIWDQEEAGDVSTGEGCKVQRTC